MFFSEYMKIIKVPCLLENLKISILCPIWCNLIIYYFFSKKKKSSLMYLFHEKISQMKNNYWREIIIPGFHVLLWLLFFCLENWFSMQNNNYEKHLNKMNEIRHLFLSGIHSDYINRYKCINWYVLTFVSFRIWKHFRICNIIRIIDSVKRKVKFSISSPHIFDETTYIYLHFIIRKNDNIKFYVTKAVI